MFKKISVIKNATKVLSLRSSFIPYKGVLLRNKHTTTKSRNTMIKEPTQNFLHEPIPGINFSELIERRHRLMEALVVSNFVRGKKTNHLVVVPAPGFGEHSKSNIDLVYLTGIVDPKTCLVLTCIDGGDLRSILFHEPVHSPITLLGGTGTPAQLMKSLQIDQIYPLSHMEAYLNGIFKSDQFKIWFDDSSGNSMVKRIITELSYLPGVNGYEAPNTHLQALRLIKSPAEINTIRDTCQITSRAFNHAMALSKPDTTAFTIRSIIQNDCEERGVRKLNININETRSGHDDIIAADVDPPQGDLLIVDANPQGNDNGAGLTRTWPTCGEFTPRQKLLYNGIYNVQQQMIKSMQAGQVQTMGQLYKKMRTGLSKELRNISFMKTATTKQIAKVIPSLLKNKLTHFVGMEEGQNNPAANRNTVFSPGMVISLKPGIYVAENRDDVNENYRGMSVQLQDNILIKEDGVEVLSQDAIESPHDIEQTVGKDDVGIRPYT